jgi:class 3 adenylate cyclase
VAQVRGRTLTFLFTDIEDSTRRWQADRDVMAAALPITMQRSSG